METRDQKPDAGESRSRLHGAAVGLVALAALATAAIVALAATTWIGATFPGFFVLENGVVASIGRSDWPASRTAIYQHIVTDVDDTPVESGSDVYKRVAARPAGTTFTYRLENATTHRSVTVASRVLSSSDYWMIFGGYFATGLLYLLLALLGAVLSADPQLGRALVLVGSAGGAYALSAVGIYGPDSPIRLHAFIEALFPATLVCLALAFPRPASQIAKPAAALAWTLSLALALPYQLMLQQPAAYSALHAACELYLGLAGVAVVTRLVVAAAAPGQARTPVLPSALIGAVLGLGTPAIIFLVSGVTGGRIPVNMCTATAFLFPLCFAHGIVREHLAARRIAPRTLGMATSE
jgi:hypothetical protein